MTGLEKDLMLNKKSVDLPKLKLYIEEKHPEDKVWFYRLCCETNEDGKLRSFMEIKSEFYKKYFPQLQELSSRQKLFADWNIDD